MAGMNILPAIARAIGRGGRGFATDRRGAIAILMAAVLVPAILAVGLAVDIGRAYLAEIRLRNALDASALAMARLAPTGEDPSTKAQQQDVLNKYFHKNYDSALGDLQGQPSIDPVDDNPNRLEIKATVRVPMTFMTLAGYDTLDVASDIVVQREVPGIEVALVLDNTGSMKSGGRMDDLRNAARNFSQTLYDAVPADADRPPHIAVVPYATTVNLGDELADSNLKRPCDVAPKDFFESVEFNGSVGAGEGVFLYLKNDGDEYIKVEFPIQEIKNDNFDPDVVSFGGFVRREYSEWKWVATKIKFNGSGEDCYIMRDSEHGGVEDTSSSDICGARDVSSFPSSLADYVPVQPDCDKLNLKDCEDADALEAYYEAYYYDETDSPNHEYDEDNPPWTRNGCVMAQDDYDTDDATTISDDGGSWTRYFWTPEPELDQSFTWHDDFGNQWPPVQEEHSRSNADSQGPAIGCPTPITPVTADESGEGENSTVVKAIDNLKAWRRGGTFSDIGMLWGWRVLAPNAPFDEGVEYDNDEWNKYAILMTDGQSQNYQNDFTPYGFDEELSAEDINKNLEKICQNMKDEGITIYTLTFKENDDEVENTFESCASDSDKAFLNVDSGDQLVSAFENIAGQIARLRIAR